MQSTLLTTMNSAAPGDMGAATRVRTVGGSLGVAVLGAVHSNRMADVLAEQLGTGVEKRLTAGGEPTPAHAPRARSGPVAVGATRALLCAAAPHSGRDRSARDRSRRPHGRRSHIRYRQDSASGSGSARCRGGGHLRRYGQRCGGPTMTSAEQQ
ncbi:hypothetical protein AB0D09_10695 [Streptomyces sp. NPDC049097]|uniref:hypothetical protein n=1 Tax=unclassified Streptomyces TaxID=2593676 RepID=UPI003431E367